MKQSRTMKPDGPEGGGASRISLLIKVSVVLTLISVSFLILARSYLPVMELSGTLFAAIFVLFEIIRMCVFFGIFSIRWLTRNFEADLQTFVFAYAALGALVFSLFRLAFDVGAISATQNVSDSLVANYFTYLIVIFLLLGFLIASFIPPTRKISVSNQNRALGVTIASTIGLGSILLMFFNESNSQASMPGFFSLSMVPVLIWGVWVFWKNWLRWNNRSYALISIAVILYIPALFADSMTTSSNDIFRAVSNFFGTLCPLILFIAISGESLNRPYSRLKHLREQFNQEMKLLDETRSEVKSSQLKLNETERRFQRLVDIANEGIMISDSNLTIVFVNPKMASILGYDVDELVGMRLFSLVDGENRRQMQLRLDNRRAGAFEEYEIEYIRKDGGRISAIVGASPIMDDKGGYQGAIAVISDITKRKEMERSLIEERDKAQAYFDFLAHDMANILSPIMVYSEMSNIDKKIPADLRFKIERIMEQSQRAYSLIQTLRKLEEMGNVRPDQLETIDLRTALSAAEDTVRREHPAKRFTINNDIPDSDGMPVRGGRWIEDVIYEIVENAVRHSSRDQATVDVRVASKNDGPGRSFWQLEIADNGPGIDRTQRELLASPLTVTKRDFKGVGSSLPFCSSILQNLGGGMSIEDRVPGSPEKGAKIVIRLVKGD